MKNILLLFLTSLAVIVQSIPNAIESIQLQQINSRKYISVKYLFEHSIFEDPMYLPSLLTQQLINQFNLSYLQIRMGHINNQDIESQHGISIIFNNRIINKEKFKHLLNGVFGISIKALNNYYIYEVEQKQYVFNMDPDDVFCSQNLQKIFRMLPCGKHSGFSSYFPTNSFDHSVYFQFKTSIEKDQIKYQIEMISQIDSDIQQLKIRGSPCALFNKSLIIKQKQIQPYVKSRVIILDKKIKANNKRQIIQDIFISGNWYSFKGILTHKIEVQEQKINTITIYHHLGQYLQIDVNKLKVRELNNQSIYYQVAFRNQNQSNKIIKIVFNNISKEQNLHVQIPYSKKIRNFQQLFSTNRGSSEQFLKSITIIKTHNSTKRLISKNNLIDKTIQADNAMPFNIFTFTMALIGYIWISVWKTFVKSVEDNTLSQQETSQSNQIVKKQN